MLRFVNFIHDLTVVVLCSFLFTSVVVGAATVIFVLAVG
jgi:hypothetical protein